MVLGHRGYRLKYVENTLEALVKAIEMGADGVEFDVRLTRDGIPIVFHDPSLERLAGLRKLVGYLTLNDLEMVKLLGRFSIPTLDEALDELGRIARDLVIDIEIKDYRASIKAYRLVEDRGLLDRTIFTSSNPRTLKAIRKVSPHAKLGYIVRSSLSVYNPFLLQKELNIQVATVSLGLKKTLGLRAFKRYLRSLKLVGLNIALWPLNSSRDLAELWGLYDIAITDNVEHIVKTLKKITDIEKL